jgi:hypothetical protein
VIGHGLELALGLASIIRHRLCGGNSLLQRQAVHAFVLQLSQARQAWQQMACFGEVHGRLWVTASVPRV